MLENFGTFFENLNGTVECHNSTGMGAVVCSLATSHVVSNCI